MLWSGHTKRELVSISDQPIQTEPVIATLIIAHPDDECMFFTPTINAFLSRGIKVYVICLSSGNYYGKGEIRKRELILSCNTLGIPASRVYIEDSPKLQDGAEWNPSDGVIAIRKAFRSFDILPDFILSFDSFGVSGHKNHKSTYLAIQELISQQREMEEKLIRVFKLCSVGIVRKHIAILDLWFALIERLFDRVDLLIVGKWENSLQAMRQHKSQLVWFRWLYILFARYTMINTFKEL
ncbi:n-acetylglucosaminyl-phosphatidylinositol de-n-acetylase [Anaeramoeba flamelloides]|uniref:N-acetylglucosaminylphosphatidylinositol deacetylase n=1 Tax=Anaeramoeba flamelloides TaxID=1746091 RepID=A0AAV7YCY9_9EUKA|nr:n-acetylglucosaminyl-phosphatidylinositol de-n-acetylase [Anaeramoeba flamelloides]KAJ6234316.1 n-acetylglucosaminyl-phosphatidylinositol de-n-acetylase [Anaeramoeba flamelloides]